MLSELFRVFFWVNSVNVPVHWLIEPKYNENSLLFVWKFSWQIILGHIGVFSFCIAAGNYLIHLKTLQLCVVLLNLFFAFEQVDLVHIIPPTQTILQSFELKPHGHLEVFDQFRHVPYRIQWITLSELLYDFWGNVHIKSFYGSKNSHQRKMHKPANKRTNKQIKCE